MVFSSSEEAITEMHNQEVSVPEAGTKPPGQMYVKLKKTALTYDCFKTSNRIAAAVVSSVLKDVGIETYDDHFHVVEKRKIRRRKTLNAENQLNQRIEERNLLQQLQWKLINYFLKLFCGPHTSPAFIWKYMIFFERNIYHKKRS